MTSKAFKAGYAAIDWSILPKRSKPRVSAHKQRGAFPCPRIVRDVITPVQSMANGEVYDTMSGLRGSYRADGNPQGVEYTEIGDQERTDPVPPKVTKQECAELLDKFEAAVNRGEISE